MNINRTGKVLLILLCLVGAVLITACTHTPDIPSISELKQLIQKASETDNQVYAKQWSKQELYAHYKPYFTKRYVDEMVLVGGNLIEQDGKWGTAFAGSEPLQGTFIVPPGSDTDSGFKISGNTDDELLTVVYQVKEGLYPGHREKLTFVWQDETWKIDLLEWQDSKK